jgi:hypothetical protein
MESKQSSLTTWLNNEYIHINNILPQLPPPLANSWQKTLNELDDKNLSKRLESLLSLYQSYHEFDQRVSTQQATIIDGNGQEKMVKQLFLGASRGWYLTLDGQTAIAGVPTPQGWQWQHQTPIPSKNIKDAFAMLEHKIEAKLTTLPMSLTIEMLQGQ